MHVLSIKCKLNNMMMRKIFTLITFIFVMSAAAMAQTDTFHLDKTYTLDANGTISLQSDDAKVTVLGSNRNDVHVTVDYKLDFDGISLGDYKSFDMKLWTEGGNLNIKEKPREMDGMRLGITNKTYTITIEAPKNANLMFSGDDEDYKIKNINGEIHIKADDADITCISCGGNLFAYRLDDGTITMDRGKGTLKISADDGRANIKNGLFKQIKLQADDGHFKIQNSAPAQSSYQIALEDGKLQLNLADGNRSGAVEVNINTDDGDINIQTDAREHDKYHISADDADITFNVAEGGAIVSIYHSDANISHGSSYHVLNRMEGIIKYQLNEGGAAVQMNVDDANIELQ